MNSALIDKGIVVSLLASFLFYFSIGAFGAFIKDLYDNFTNKNKKIQLIEVFIAATSTAFIFIGAQDYLTTKFSMNIIVFLTFLCGVLGFEIFGKINSIRGFKTSVLDVLKIKKTLDSANAVLELSKLLDNEKNKEELNIPKEVEVPPEKKENVEEDLLSKIIMEQTKK